MWARRLKGSEPAQRLVAGIGRAFVDALSESRAEVVICGRWAAHPEDVARELLSQGRSVTFVRCDVTDEDDLHNLVEAAGDSDILVNNAGYGVQSPWTDVSLESWRVVMALNLEAGTGAENFRVLEMLETVRLGRGMYIRSTTARPPPLL